MGEKSKTPKKAASPKSAKKTKTLAFRSKETIDDSDDMLSSGKEQEESSGEEESSSEEEEVVVAVAKEPVKEKAKKATISTPSRPTAPVQQTQTQTQTPGRNSTDYKPPVDFNPLSVAEYSSKNPFSAKNLAGKEIWYITAPSNISLSALNTLNPIDVAEGNPVMQADGRSYCLRTEEDSTKNGAGLGILVPDSTGQYRTAKQSIQKVFRIVEAPPTTFLAPGDAQKPKPVKVQPKGLKQRFTPIGAIATAQDDVEDVDMMDVDEPEPEVKSEERKKKKQKSSHAETEDGDKKKKKKKSKADEP